MKLEERIRNCIGQRHDNVILRSEVADLGSASQVTHVLKLLQEDGELLRLSKGVYLSLIHI